MDNFLIWLYTGSKEYCHVNSCFMNWVVGLGQEQSSQCGCVCVNSSVKQLSNLSQCSKPSFFVISIDYNNCVPTSLKTNLSVRTQWPGFNWKTLSAVEHVGTMSCLRLRVSWILPKKDTKRTFKKKGLFLLNVQPEQWWKAVRSCRNLKTIKIRLFIKGGFCFHLSVWRQTEIDRHTPSLLHIQFLWWGATDLARSGTN